MGVGTPPYSSIGASQLKSVTTPPPPAAPSLLTAQAVDVDQINLDWQDNSSDELDFHIEVSDDGATGWAEISPATVAANVVHKEVTGLASDTLKYYRVRAHSASGYSGYSNVAYARTFAAVAQPTNLAATPYSGTEVDLSFQDNSTAEDDHRLERKEGAGAFSEVKTISANVTGCRDTGLTPGHTYVFRVRAKAGAAYSDYSNEVTVTTISVPGAPSAIVISEVQDTTVRLTWTPPRRAGRSSATRSRARRMIRRGPRSPRFIPRSAATSRSASRPRNSFISGSVRLTPPATAPTPRPRARRRSPPTRPLFSRSG